MQKEWAATVGKAGPKVPAKGSTDGSQNKRKRSIRPPGRQRKYDAKADKELADDWEVAKRNGTYKADYARAKGYSTKDFDRLLNRVSKAKS